MSRSLLWGLIGSITILSGCATSRQVVLHPIEKEDIERIKVGQLFSPKKDGYFLSDLYLQEVAKARVEEIKKGN